MRRQRVAALVLVGVVAGPDGCKKNSAELPIPPVMAQSGSASGQGGGGGNGQGGATAAGGMGGATSEDCFDGADDDGDGRAGCIQNDPACVKLGICTGGDACAATKTIADPTVKLHGDNTDHAALLGLSCATQQPGNEGPANVYRVVAASDGILDASVVTDPKADMSQNDQLIAVRTSCSNAKSELGCGNLNSPAPNCQHVPVHKGDTLYIAVAGFSLLDSGGFELTVKTRPRVCGDGVIDPPEECDDGNTVSGDGCSASCQIELNESEPNDTVQQATAFHEPMIGKLTPADPVDVISFSITKPNTSLLATAISAIAGKSCPPPSDYVETKLELIASDGVTVLATDDDIMHIPAVVSYEPLAPGTYYLAIARGSHALPNYSTFYRWKIETSP